MINRAYLLVLFFLFSTGGIIPFGARAQGMQSVFDRFLQDIDKNFYTYLDSLDLLFADYLELDWEEFDVQEAIFPFSYHSGYTNPIIRGTPYQLYSASDITLFYGQKIDIPLVSLPDVRLLKPTEKEIASFWRALHTSDFTVTYAACVRQMKELQLNDWGYFLLLQHVISMNYAKLLPEERTLLSFYLLTHAGFKTKVCATLENHILLLISFRENIYGYPFIQVKDEKYYLWASSPAPVKKVFTFAENYPGNIRPVSLLFTEPLRFTDTPVCPNIQDPYSLFVEMTINKNLLDFYSSIPLCDMQVYFLSAPTLPFQDEMNNKLLPLLKDKTPYEQIELLLQITQQIAIHKKDSEIHGEETYYFPEEFVFYPYSDCEDFCVFLYWLIKKYTSANLLFLYYPQHIALAIEKMDGYNGATFWYEDKEFFICDPSYIGSKPGEVVPIYKSVEPVYVQDYKKEK